MKRKLKRSQVQREPSPSAGKRENFLKKQIDSNTHLPVLRGKLYHDRKILQHDVMGMEDRSSKKGVGAWREEKKKLRKKEGGGLSCLKW